MTAIPLAEPFDPTYFEELAAAEDRHFWFRSRNDAIVGVLRGVVGPGSRILEVGCGNGNVLTAIDRAFPSATVVGMDLFAEGLRFARQRCDCPLVQGDIRLPPLRGQFDVVGAFDVVEHLDDDSGALLSLGRLLKPGGHLVLTVPANPSLWSYYDEACGHRRRYRPADLRQTIQRAGLEVSYMSYFMAPLVPILWLRRKLGEHSRRSGRKDVRELATEELRVPWGVNGMLGFLLRREIRHLSGGGRLPFGTSLLAVARSPGSDVHPGAGQAPPPISSSTA